MSQPKSNKQIQQHHKTKVRKSATFTIKKPIKTDKERYNKNTQKIS